MLIVKFGCSHKNLKSVAESLDEIASYLQKEGISVVSEPQVKVIAKLVDSGDPGVREKSLQVLGEIYKVLDEEIYSIMGKLSVKSNGLLEQRFKKIKGLGASSSNIGLTAPSKSNPSSKPA
jgi:cytoskeleton-associated protein 5